MWWPTHARGPLRTQAVLLSSAPQASSGRSAGTGRASASRHPSARAAHHERPARRARRAPPSRRRGWRWGGRGAGTGRRCRPGARARPRRGARSARRRGCRSSSPAGRRRRRAAGGGAASRGASRPRSAEPGATDGGDGRVRAPAREHDRPLAPGQQRLLGRAQVDQAPRRARGRRPSPRRASPRGACAPAAARRRPRRRPGRPGGSPRCPSRRRSRRREGGRRGGDGVARPIGRRRAGDSQQAGRRAAVRAGDGLGVEAPVGRVLVLGAAAVAHGEAGHRGAARGRRGRRDDRVARAAGRAVDERVAVAAVGGVAQLGEAVVAGGGVGGDARPTARRRRVAGEDREAAVAQRRQLAPASTRSTDASGGRLGGRGAPGSARPPRGRPRPRRSTPAASLSTKPARPRSRGQAVDVRAEADPLHRPLHPHADAPRRRSRRRALDELPEDVPGARLGLLDARDVLGAGHDDVVGEPLVRRPGRRRSRPSPPSAGRAGAPRRGPR